MRLNVIILNYRTPAVTIDCLRSLAPEVEAFGDARVVVVDNRSEDGSPDAIEAAIHQQGWSDWAEVVRSPINGGFSYGNNIGLRRRSAEAYLLLNSDTIVRPGAVAELWRAMEQNPRAGIVAPRLEWRDGTAQISAFRDISPASELIRGAGTGPITRLLRRSDVPIAVSDGPIEPRWVSFAACMIRRQALEQIGLMDEGYFMYFEDADYCRRARQGGWAVLYWPSAHVVHLRGGSSPVKTQAAQRQRLSRYYYESRSRYFVRFYGRAGLWAANMLWTVGHAIALVRQTFGRKQPHACKCEWRDIWVGATRTPRLTIPNGPPEPEVIRT